jgi:hypothetical protein
MNVNGGWWTKERRMLSGALVMSLILQDAAKWSINLARKTKYAGVSQLGLHSLITIIQLPLTAKSSTSKEICF